MGTDDGSEALSYRELRDDVLEIATETVADGKTAWRGGFGCAASEYWIEGKYVERADPVPIPIKVAVAIAICALLREVGQPVEDADEKLVLRLASCMGGDTLEGHFDAASLDHIRVDAVASMSSGSLRQLDAFWGQSRSDSSPIPACGDDPSQ